MPSKYIRINNNTYKRTDMTQEFEDWLVSGNVICVRDSSGKYYASQDALYRNRLYTKEQEWEYYRKEFIN